MTANKEVQKIAVLDDYQGVALNLAELEASDGLWILSGTPPGRVLEITAWRTSLGSATWRSLSRNDALSASGSPAEHATGESGSPQLDRYC